MTTAQVPAYVLRGHASPVHCLHWPTTFLVVFDGDAAAIATTSSTASPAAASASSPQLGASSAARRRGRRRRRIDLISGDEQGYVICWSLSHLRPVAIWRAHQSGKTVLSISSWSDTIATHGRDNKLYLWRLLPDTPMSTTLPLAATPDESRQRPFLVASLDVNALNFTQAAFCPYRYRDRSAGDGAAAAASVLTAAAPSADRDSHSQGGRSRGEQSSEEQVLAEQHHGEDLLVAVPALIGNAYIDIYALPRAHRLIGRIALPDSSARNTVTALALCYPLLAAGYEDGSVALFHIDVERVDREQQRQDGTWQCVKAWKGVHQEAVLSVCFHTASSEAAAAAAAAAGMHTVEDSRLGASTDRQSDSREMPRLLLSCGIDDRIAAYDLPPGIGLAPSADAPGSSTTPAARSASSAAATAAALKSAMNSIEPVVQRTRHAGQQSLTIISRIGLTPTGGPVLNQGSGLGLTAGWDGRGRLYALSSPPSRSHSRLQPESSTMEELVRVAIDDDAADAGAEGVADAATDAEADGGARQGTVADRHAVGDVDATAPREADARQEAAAAKQDPLRSTGEGDGDGDGVARASAAAEGDREGEGVRQVAVLKYHRSILHAAALRPPPSFITPPATLPDSRDTLRDANAKSTGADVATGPRSAAAFAAAAAAVAEEEKIEHDAISVSLALGGKDGKISLWQPTLNFSR